MSRPLHVGIGAHLLSRGRSYRAAGISRHTANLVQALGRLDAPERVTAFVGPGMGGREGRVELRASRFPTERPPVRILWEQIAGPFTGVDLFHGTAYAVPLAARFPTIVTVHDLSFIRFPKLFNKANRLYLNAITRLSVAKARRVIAVSEATKRELVNLIGTPAAKVVAIPNGVEACFRPMDAAEFRRAKGLPDQFILHLGTIEPRKNLPVLVRAYARLKEKGLPHKLVLAGGKGWLYESLFAEVRARGLEGDVLFPGYVPFEEQPFWYNAAAALACPSIYEGFGLPPLEAMACGTPVVCSNASSLPEVVGDAALTVDPHDEVALSDALTRLIEDDALRARLREAGLTRARLFDWDDVARRTLAVYRDAA